MPASVRAPKVLDSGDGWIGLEGFEYVPRRRPEEIPLDVAEALGTFYRHGARNGGGLAHGDFAPWNLLQLAEGWALVDWEDAKDRAEPFHDLFHYAFQSHALINRLSAPSVVEGFLRVVGPLGAAARIYASAADLDHRDVPAYFRAYLDDLSPLIGRSADAEAKMLGRARMLRVLRELG
jgi:hypothetical protein